MARDPWFVGSERVILDLHFDACVFQRDRRPGLVRTGSTSVTTHGGGIAYEAPPARDVQPLLAELVDWLERGDLGAHVVVRAAMAHLHAVSIHPFRDGNGRLSRILQSLVLARDGLVPAEFASIEEYLGERAPAYYAVLQQVQGGRYQPERDASAWLEFCIDAHLAQALRRLEQVAAAAARWTLLEEIADGRGWSDRLAIALEQALVGGVDRAGYCREAGIAARTASIDLRRLVDAGLVVSQGRGRSVRYHAAAELRRRVAAVI